MEQIGVFDFLYKNYKITKPIRLIEFFAGYGSQALALKYLGVPFEHWKICEWAVKSIQAYKDIHYDNVNIDYSKGFNKEYLMSYLFDKHISMDYNKPMTKEQIARLSEQQLRTIYNNIQIEKNTVDIQQTDAEDLNIIETNKYDYILTYSFPCQDLSLAGKRKGMSDTSTRSGMLWEVERILNECNELGTLPQILLMENVPQVHSQDSIEDFRKWQLALEKLGYQSYWQDLIATDYGIPQTRNRCFMISILGDYNYNFPKPKKLELKLKDLLENEVDEKYYLSDKMINCFLSESENSKFPRKERFLETLERTNEKSIAATLCTTGGTRATDNFIKVKNATKKGYLEATVGDGIDISSRMEHHRGTVQKDKCQTITTASGNERGVVIDKPKVLGGIGKKDSNNNTQWKQQNRIYDNKLAISVTTAFNPYYYNDLRIRKLTPRECFRLMGVRDEDYDRCVKNQSDSSLYHLAGDSIVVDVLMAIFKKLM